MSSMALLQCSNECQIEPFAGLIRCRSEHLVQLVYQTQISSPACSLPDRFRIHIHLKFDLASPLNPLIVHLGVTRIHLPDLPRHFLNFPLA